MVFVEGYLTRVTPVGRSLGFSQTSAQLLQSGSGVKAGAPEGHSGSSLLSAVAPAASAKRGEKKVLLFPLQMSTDRLEMPTGRGHGQGAGLLRDAGERFLCSSLWLCSTGKGGYELEAWLGRAVI